MSEVAVYQAGAALMVLMAGATFIVLQYVVAPYGRHMRQGWGPSVSNQLGWVMMEAPAPVSFLLIYGAGDHALSRVPLVLLGLWQLHYVHRAFIFPLRTRTTGKRMPLLIVGLGALFNGFNGLLNALWVGHLAAFPDSWLVDPRFLLGVAVFAVGLVTNLWADTQLIRLREEGNGYVVPRGGLFEYVSSPNYLGEILEWIGWALATWSLAGAGFALYTAANLVPRALANRAWYRATFDDYPRSRRALIPGLL